MRLTGKASRDFKAWYKNVYCAEQSLIEFLLKDLIYVLFFTLSDYEKWGVYQKFFRYKGYCLSISNPFGDWMLKVTIDDSSTHITSYRKSWESAADSGFLIIQSEINGDI